MFFFKNHAVNEAGRLSFFKKKTFEVKGNGLHSSFNVFQKPSTWHAIKTNYKTLDYSSRDLLNFYF